MDVHLDRMGCWTARVGPIHLGCTLSLSTLTNSHLEIRQLKQVHGPTILDDGSFTDESAEADGLITGRAGMALIIKTADCVPVTLTDGKRLGIIHAGWRGTAAGIVGKLPRWFNLEQCQAVIGPAISAARYEVDEDLYGPWLEREPQLDDWLSKAEPGSTKRHLDLKGFVAEQLRQLGMASKNITTIPICTYDSRLPSYRREGKKAKRIFHYIYRTKA